MKKCIILSLVVISLACTLFADDKTESTANDFMKKIFAGDIKEAKEISSVPFSFDCKDLIKEDKDLDKYFKQITDQNGKINIDLISIKEIESKKGVHKDLKDEIIIYEIECKINNSLQKLQIFVRKKDGKVVGLFG